MTPRSVRWLTLIACALAAVVAQGFAQSSQAPVTSSTSGAGPTPLSLSMIFTAFMVMLGPVKVVAPFAKLTSGMDEAEARRIAGKAFGFACAGGLVAAVVGQNTLVSWGISPSTLHLAGGVVLLMVALRTVLEQYEPAAAAPTAVGSRNIALSPLTFPTILTPHGIAILILLLAVTRDATRDAYIMGLFLVVMVLNWVVMWFARPIVRRGAIGLAILGAVLGVLQVALAVQIMLDALRSMHVLPSL
jgi:multiple antibiotic resistance protein